MKGMIKFKPFMYLKKNNFMMKGFLYTILMIFSSTSAFSQVENVKSQYIGFNLLQLPSSTLNMNYTIEHKHRFTSMVDFGYAIEYNDYYDFIGSMLTPSVRIEDQYTINKQSGGYFKFGGFYNFREGYDEPNFFHLGFFVTSSLVMEEGISNSIEEYYEYPNGKEVNQNVFLVGFSTSVGYEFDLARRLKSSFDFQLSFPSSNYANLYSYKNFIPGMGYKEIDPMWFPMLIFNVKYLLDFEAKIKD